LRYFFHTHRPPTRSPLFPYTTLFRSKSEWEEHVVGTLEFAGIPVTCASLWTLAACRRKPIANALLQLAGLPIPRWTVAQGKIEEDRKSTRLNSSHVSISYAVFCLKKK